MGEESESLPRFGYCRRLYSGGPWENAGTHSSQIIQCAISCTGLFKKKPQLNISPMRTTFTGKKHEVA